MDKNNQLETAPIGKLVFKLAIPTVMAQLVNLLYNIVDRIYVGRIPEIGSLSLAGLGVTFPIILLVSAFAMLAGMGGASRAAVSMGEKDNDKAEKILGNCTMLLIIFSVVLAVVFMLTKNQILMKFGDELWYIYTREEIREARLMESRGYSREKVQQIFSSQLKEAEYRKHCSVVIDNNEGLEEMQRQIDAAVCAI